VLILCEAKHCAHPLKKIKKLVGFLHTGRGKLLGQMMDLVSAKATNE
jgi:hypothetical protein